jgi:hypothetical protein
MIVKNPVVLLIALISFCPAIFAQKNIKLFGKITSISGEPIFMANIYFDKTEVGTYSDEKGNFVLEHPDDAVFENGLIFSALGFESDTLHGFNYLDEIKISLSPKEYQLGEVLVIEKRNPKKFLFEKNLGLYDKKENASYASNTGKVICLYIENSEKRIGRIKDAKFRFSAVKNKPFIRIHLYNVEIKDGTEIIPGESLLKSNYIFQLNNEKSLKVNFEHENILIGESGYL